MSGASGREHHLRVLVLSGLLLCLSEIHPNGLRDPAPIAVGSLPCLLHCLGEHGLAVRNLHRHPTQCRWSATSVFSSVLSANSNSQGPID